MIVTATQVTILSNITASAATITSSELIPIIQDRIVLMTNNYFLTDLSLQDAMTFNATARTIVANNNWVNYNFLANDDCMIYNSYRNDGYYTISTVSNKTLTLATGATVVAELSGRSILASVVKWPGPVQQIAALMVAYDYDIREKSAANIKSHSLGPFRETFTDGEKDEWGYPLKITNMLTDYKIARLM